MNILEDIQKLQFLQSMMSQQQGQGMSPAQMPGGMPQQEGMQDPQGGAQQQIPTTPPQQQQPPNPLGMGAASAMESAKRSLGMNEEQKRHAMGHALRNFSAGMMQNAPAPGSGIAGAIGMLNAGFGPGMDAYNQEQKEFEKHNFLMEQAHKAEELERKRDERAQARHLHLMDLEKNKLSLAKDMYSLRKQALVQKKGEMTQNDQELLSEGVTPMSSLKTGPERKAAVDHIKSHHKLGKTSRHIIEDTNLIKQIYRENPKLSEHWGVIMQSALSKNPSIIRQKLNKFTIPEDVQRDGWLVSKTLNDLVTRRVEGSNARASVFLEALYKDASANPLMPASATLAIMDRINQAALEDYEDAEMVTEYGKKHGVYYPALRPIHEPASEKKEETLSENPADALSAEQLLEMRKKLTGG